VNQFNKKKQTHINYEKKKEFIRSICHSPRLLYKFVKIRKKQRVEIQAVQTRREDE